MWCSESLRRDSECDRLVDHVHCHRSHLASHTAGCRNPTPKEFDVAAYIMTDLELPKMTAQVLEIAAFEGP